MIGRPRSLLLSSCFVAAASCAAVQESEGACRAPVAEPIRAPSVDDLAGRYRLIFVGTSGEAVGKRVEGELVLAARPAALRPVLGLDLVPLADVAEPVFGATTADLEAVGAYVSGSLRSEDPEAPGVVLRVDQGGNEVGLTLRLGSERNRRGHFILDGAFVLAPIVELHRAGFFGRWDASLGPTTYRAGGFFCALRTGAR